MTRKTYILTGLLCGGVLLTSDGCAMLTAKTVGTAVATHVGKKVVKDAVTKDDEEKQTAEAPKKAD